MKNREVMRHVEHGPSEREVKGSYDFVGGEACVCVCVFREETTHNAEVDYVCNV